MCVVGLCVLVCTHVYAPDVSLIIYSRNLNKSQSQKQQEGKNVVLGQGYYFSLFLL